MSLKNINLLLFLILFQLQCKSQKVDLSYTSEILRIIPVSENVFRHVSYLETDDFGKVACNGLIFIRNNEAIVFDTPTHNKESEELLAWLTNEKKAIVKAIVVNHFHIDCLGGLAAFHNHNIPSYANEKTIELAKKDYETIPQVGFKLQNELEIGGATIMNKHFGEAHTKDNIISYIPSEELIYGGCMIKTVNASKGNLEDANVAKWSNTIQNIKDNYPNLKVIVPGHGKPGGIELLDYTIKLFKTN